MPKATTAQSLRYWFDDDIGTNVQTSNVLDGSSVTISATSLVDGIHILHYLRNIPAGIVELTDEISAQIEESLYTEKVNGYYADALEAWMAEHEIVYNQEAINALNAQAEDTVQESPAE